MRKLYSFFAALCFVAMPQSVLADDWTYDFEDFSTVYGDHYANSSFDVTLNGLTWHCHGVSYSKNEDYDWFNGTQSMELYGESKKDRNTGPEISVFQLITPRDIGTVSFKIHEYNLHPASVGSQVDWIVEWSQDGSTWTKVGDSFQAGPDVQTIEREVNHRDAYVRIVRADYATFDYKSVTSNNKITNFDDFTITDVKTGPTAPTLTVSKTDVDFGSMTMGKSKMDTVTVKYSGVEGADKPSYELVGIDAASFQYTVSQTAVGEDSLFITATAQHSGTVAAAINVAYGNLTAGISLSVFGTKPRPNILFSGGEGTEESPYLISSKEDLLELSDIVDKDSTDFAGKYFLMTNSIDLKSVSQFTPIGNQLRGAGVENMRYFRGYFDGGGYTITGLKENYESGLSVGLFGIIYDATIKNLTLASSTVKGSSAVGGLVGLSRGNSTIENCRVASDVTVSGAAFVAGICASAFLEGKLTISQCVNAATVTGGYAAGVISANQQDGTTIERCGNQGVITVSSYDGGGVVALSDYASTNILNCYNTGSVTFDGTQQFGGGILGRVHYYLSDEDKTKVRVENCYNAAVLTVNGYGSVVAPVIPANNVVPADDGYDTNRLTVKNCFYASDLSVSSESVLGVTPMTSDAMKDASFLTLLNQDKPVQYWVFNDGENQGYPVPEGSTDISAVKEVTEDGKYGIRVVDGTISVDGAVGSYEIYDVNGQRVSPSVTTPGIYIVKIATDKGMRAVKIMKR